MKQAVFRSITLVVCLAFCLATSVCATHAAARRPNIVFILADDFGYHQLGCYENDFYETPHVDSLAAAGMRFTDAYAACPVCSPTRASIMTGKYPARLHLTDFIPGGKRLPPGSTLRTPDWTRNLPLKEVTLAEALQASGYATGHFGKWHLNKDKEYRPGRPGDPGSQGFDVVLTTHKPGLSIGKPSPFDDDAHHVREITEAALTFIESHREEPFFCYVTHNSIHTPLRERDELVAKYQRKEGANDEDHKPMVAAMVETLDHSVGRILAALDRWGLASNTMVIFFSDNGCLWGADVLKPLRGCKAQLYEGGIRVPLIVRWPGVIHAGSQCGVPVVSVDFFPTIMAAVGVEVDDPQIDGCNLLGLLKQTNDLDRAAIYWHYPHYHSAGVAPGGAVRAGRYKLIERFEQSAAGPGTPGALELFDLEADISEQHDLVDERPHLATELHRQLATWRTTIGAQSMEER